MPNVIYHPKAGDPQRTTWRGFEFEAGKPTDIPDTEENKDTIRRAAANSFFEVSGAKDQGKFDKVEPIEIPANILERMPDEKIALATRIAGRTVADLLEAETVIKAEIDRRKGPKKPVDEASARRAAPKI